MPASPVKSVSEFGKSKIISWVKLIAVTGSAQVLVQAVGFFSGILVIRLLSTQEYAFYIIANTVLGTMTILADGGIGAGVMAQGAKVYEDRLKLGAVVATGLFLRKRFAIFSILLSLPLLMYLLLNNGAGWTTVVLICITLIPAFYAGLWDSLLVIVPQLHQSVVPLQKNQVMVGFGRLFLSGLLLFVFPWAYIAILAGGIPRLLGNVQMKKLNQEHADISNGKDEQVQAEILKMVRKYMPGAIYFSFSGQITLWLISVFGNSTSVAQIGALGRFSMILTVLTAVIGTLIIPRFARMTKNRTRLFKRYFQIIAGLFLMLILVVWLTYLFPDQILWILGGNYKNLQFELILCITGTCLGVASDLAFSMLSSRGWMYNPAVYIGVNVLSIAMSALFFDITTLQGALTMGIVISSSLFIMNMLFFIWHNLKPE